MACTLEIKDLRDEMAKLISDNKKKDAMMARKDAIIAALVTKNEEILGEVADLKRRLRRYENPNTPVSCNNIPQEEKKAQVRAAKAGTPPKTPGRKKGHVGVSHNRRSVRTVRNAAENCENCGSKMISKTGESTKQITDLPQIPQAETVTHIIDQYECGECGDKGEADAPESTEGTSLGPNILSIITSMWDNGATITAIKEHMDIFEFDMSRGAIQTALKAVSNRLEPTADGIRQSLKESTRLKADETTYVLYNKRGYVWAFIGDDGVLIVVAGTRGQAVIDEFCPYTDIPITVDGYSAYNIFLILQRCWAHILRDAEDAACDELTRMLLRILQEIFHEAKELQKLYHGSRWPPPRIPDVRLHRLEQRCRMVAWMYTHLGIRFGTTLTRALDNLLTFVKYPGMEPTNNESERMLRKVVIHRKIRQRLVTTGGMKMFGVLMTCMLTWRKRGLSPQKMLLETLRTT